MNKKEEIRTIYWYIEKLEELEKLEKETSNNFELGGRFRDYIQSLKEGKKFDWEKRHPMHL
jgi:hypothetical protein|tara:strand:+ start:1034 stop:1216 length:183 start_codon:yes stop_codon:yes gene_type:complete